jgi:hypothetical protein
MAGKSPIENPRSILKTHTSSGMSSWTIAAKSSAALIGPTLTRHGIGGSSAAAIAGVLRLVTIPEKDPANMETCWLCQGTGKRDDEVARQHRAVDPTYSCNGCDGKGHSVKWPSKWTDVGNVARWGHLDLDALKAAKVAERREMVEEMRLKVGLSFDDFETGFRACKAAHELWKGLPEPKPRGAAYSEYLAEQVNGSLAVAYNRADTWNSIEAKEGQSIEEWIADARLSRPTPPSSMANGARRVRWAGLAYLTMRMTTGRRSSRSSSRPFLLTTTSALSIATSEGLVMSYGDYDGPDKADKGKGRRLLQSRALPVCSGPLV